jgi:hypothetical protein
MTEYIVGLGIAFLASLVHREALYCVMLVSADFLVNEAFVRLSGHADGWAFFSMVDGLATGLLLLPVFGRLGAVIASTYCLQIIVHWSYGLASFRGPTGYDGQLMYWQMLTAIAFLQLAILIFGGLYGGLGRKRRHLGSVHRIPQAGYSAHRLSSRESGE